MTKLDDTSTIKRWAQSEIELSIIHRNGQWEIYDFAYLRLRAVHPILLQAIRTTLANMKKGIDYEGHKTETEDVNKL